jgi:hypothetical protein
MGTLRLPKMPERELVRDYLDKKNISEELLCEHFLGMIQSLFNGIA